MATYECRQCGMTVGMTCGKCGKELHHDTLTKDDGVKGRDLEVPRDHGKIKSPMCCAQDLICEATSILHYN